MYWQEAIRQSKKGTATRKQKKRNFDETFVRYEDGSCYIIVAENGKVNFSLSRMGTTRDVEGYDDWQPTE